MFPSFSKQLVHSYSKVANDSQDNLELPTTQIPRARPTPSNCQLTQTIKLICCSVGFLLAGFFLGQSFAQHGSRLSSSLALKVEPYMFKFDRLYGEKPSNASDEAWDELFPKRGGFFTHPKIAPQRSAYAVFHQLHCLNAIREAYWTTLDAAVSPTALDLETVSFGISPPHMSHCIDLLRQTLMCNPDLTVEVKNQTRGGVTGFGTVHQCRNWDQLTGWMEKWEDVGAPVLKPGQESHGQHSHHHGS